MIVEGASEVKLGKLDAAIVYRSGGSIEIMLPGDKDETASEGAMLVVAIAHKLAHEPEVVAQWIDDLSSAVDEFEGEADGDDK